MYNLPHHKERDKQVIIDFMRQYPFAFFSGVTADNMPVATQIPVFIDEKDGKLFISGHLMRNTDHHKAFMHNPNVLAVFTGPHTYVSATWYSNPSQASTWNYMSVHAKGAIKFLSDQALVDALQRLSLHYENGKADSTTVYNNLAPEYIGRLMKAIVAFEVEITELDHVFKLSQDRDEKSYDNIVEKLKQQGGDGKVIAEIMEKRKDQVYSK